MAKEEAAEVLSIDGRDVRVTNPDKPYFSRDVKLSKLEIVQYYLAVADGAVAGIRDRASAVAADSDALLSVRPHGRGDRRG